MAIFLPVTYYSPLVWCYAQLSFHWKSTEQKTFLKVRTCFLYCHMALVYFLSAVWNQPIFIFYCLSCADFLKDKCSLLLWGTTEPETRLYVCFFALLVDSGFFEGVKKVLHLGEVGLFRYFRVNDLMPSFPLFSVKFFCFVFNGVQFPPQ